jgi:GH24 family phage-related lysozyme (muramidase)
MDNASAAQRLKNFEGSIAYMYRCTGGKVTVGVGHAISDPAHAQNLGWTATPAPDQIAADFARVAAAGIGSAAPYYQPLTQCRLGDAAIDALLLADIDLFAANLTARLPAWPGYPEPAQQALFDMAYNLGVGGLLKFKNLLTACAAGNWETAATQCHRAGIGSVRNAETAGLFLQAAA